MTEAADPHFHPGEVSAQARWHSRERWSPERRSQLLWDEIPSVFHQRFAAAPYFFLATSDAQGRCDCSFKGGGTGLIHLLDSRRFAFPDFDGNGAFMSIGNILVNPRVGCLFLDFADGARLRVNGRASVLDAAQHPHLRPTGPSPFDGAPRIVLVDIEQVVPNCNQHIPLMHAVN